MTELKGENGRSNLDGFSMYNKGIESLSRNVRNYVFNKFLTCFPDNKTSRNVQTTSCRPSL